MNKSPFPEQKPYLLIVEDEFSLAEVVKMRVERLGFDPQIAETMIEAMQVIEKYPPEIIILDLNLPDGKSLDKIDSLLEVIKSQSIPPSIILTTSESNLSPAYLMALIKDGKINDYVQKPYDMAIIEKAVISAQSARNQKQELTYSKIINSNLKAQLTSTVSVIGQSKPMLDVLDRVSTIANSFKTVDAEARPCMLITGETGTGKDVLARYYHEKSLSNTSLLTIDATNLTDQLMALELFGAAKGAYTGAGNKDKIGICEAVGEGCLFIDEIGEISLELQSKLLLFIEKREFRPIGSNTVKKFHGTLIFATNRNLAEMVQEKKFRPDLFFRMQALTFHLPPLRDRDQDSLLLANDFLQHFLTLYKKPLVEFSDEAKSKILKYHWPGNIRELRQAIQNLVLHYFLTAAEAPSQVEGYMLNVNLNSLPAETQPNTFEIKGEVSQITPKEKQTVRTSRTPTTQNNKEKRKLLLKDAQKLSRLLKAGYTVDEAAKKLNLTRNAARWRLQMLDNNKKTE